MSAVGTLLVAGSLLVLLTAFALVEAGLVAVRRSRIDELAEDGDRRAWRATRILDRLPVSVTAAQLAFSAAGVGLGALLAAVVTGERDLLGTGAAPGAPRVLGPVVGTLLVVLAIVLAMLGVLVATRLALARPEQVTLALARPFLIVVRLLTPVAHVLRAVAAALTRSARSGPAADEQLAHTPSELASVVVDAQVRGVLSAAEAQVMRAALELAERTAGASMTPRVDLETVPDTATGREVLARAHATGYTRFPVHHRDVDDVVGLVHVKDLLTDPDPGALDRPIRTVLRPIVAVSQSRDLEHLLADMLAQRAHAVLVVDEFGGTAGMLSLEDVLEELVGEIADEYDEEDQPVVGAGRSWRVPGTTRRDELARLCGLELISEEAETVSGWVVEQLDRLPVDGDELRVADGWQLTVRGAEGRRADEVEVRAPER
ncbi:MAG: hemolysin family protein [Nitriliruptoraceae bacterium]